MTHEEMIKVLKAASKKLDQYDILARELVKHDIFYNFNPKIYKMLQDLGYLT